MSKRVQVYFNLHRKCLSVRDKRTGRVIDHVESIRLSNVRFIVRQGGYEKFLETGQKNVHAFVEGTLPDKWLSHGIVGRGRRAEYNPRKIPVLTNGKPTFYDKDTRQPVREASQVEIVGKEIWYD